MKKFILYIASIILLISCLDEDAFETPSVAFYPERLAFAKEDDGQNYIIYLRTTGELAGSGQVKVNVTNGEYLATTPAIVNGVITVPFEAGDRDASISVTVLDDDMAESYQAQFAFFSVSGAIRSHTATEFSLFVENTDVIFSETFNSCDAIDFTAISVKGDQIWGCTPYGIDGSTAFRMNGYSGGAQENEDWLVSNGIDLSTTTAAVLEFQTDVSFATTQSTVELFVSEKDPNGAIVTADWKRLAASYDGDGSNDTWTSSGRIDLKSYLGKKIYLGFRYISTNSAAAQWTLDNVVIEGFDPTYVPALTSLSENFESASTSGNLSIEGWGNVTQTGNALWKVRESDGNRFAQIDAVGSNESSNIGWLVTPKIDFSALATKTMSFNSQVRFADVSELKLYYSTDFDGSDVKAATWTELSYDEAVAEVGGVSDWTSSGDISLSALAGEGYIGFRFVGIGANSDTQFRLDDIVIGSGGGGYSGDYLFFDDFEGCTENYATPDNFIEAIVSGSKTDRGWGCREFGVDGGRAVRASAFGGEEGTDNAWLITANPIDLTGVSTAFLSMDVNSSFGGDGDLIAHWSTNYAGSGDPSSATWNQLTDFVGQLPAKGSGEYTFVVSNLASAVGQQVYIALQYVGGTNSSSSSWDVDNFMVSEAEPEGNTGGGGGGGGSTSNFIADAGDCAPTGTETVIVSYNFDGCTTDFATPDGFFEEVVPGYKTDRGWGCRNRGDGRGVQASAFGGEDGEDNAWLIHSDPINLSSYSNGIAISFDIEAQYSGPGEVKLVYSANYSGSGNPLADGIEWYELTNATDAIPASEGDGLVSITSNPCELTTGNIYIAFQYAGGLSSSSIAYRIDNVEIRGYN